MEAEHTEARYHPLSGGAEPVFGALPALRDVRRRRPPALSFLLRRETVRRAARLVSLLTVDYLGVMGALTTALTVKATLLGDVNVAGSWRQANHWTAFAYLITVLMFARIGLYGDRPRRAGWTKLLGGLFQVTVVALVFALASGQHFASYYIFYASFLFGSIYITAGRALHSRLSGWLLARAGYTRRALFVGSRERITALADALASMTQNAVEIAGFISTSPEDEQDPRCVGGIENIGQALATIPATEVIIADPEFPQDKAVDLVDRCHRHGITVQVAPSAINVLSKRAQFVPGQSVPLFRLQPPVFEGIDFALKRAVDLILATLGIILLSPLLLIIAVAIKLSSRGPVVYRSVRPGIGGRPFGCLKFRTMALHAEARQADLEALNEKTGALFKIRNDPRITRVGRVLRRLSLDELPQLFNVIRGEMSLVGPRPLPMRDFRLLEDWHKKRYLVLPGITGLWQVSGRSDLDFDDLVRLDFLYLESWSVVLDLWILLKTVPAVLGKRGAF